MFDPLADLCDRQGAGRCELDEALFLCFKLAELLRELRLRFPVGREKIVDRGGDAVAHLVNDVGAESLAAHCRDDFAFDLLHPEPGGRAQFVLPCGADEVLIGAAVSGVRA
ncbi:hypothetical protein [Microbacterium xylanilyticum]